MRPAQLKEWRKKLGLTQEEAGLRLGVSRVAEQNWESGATPIPKTVEDSCRYQEMLARKRERMRPEHGPVTIVFHAAPIGTPLKRAGRAHRLELIDCDSVERAMQEIEVEIGRDRTDRFDPQIIDRSSGESIWNPTELKEELDRRRSNEGKDIAELIAKLNAIADHFSSLPVLDDRTPDKIIGYNERGHFD